jgi:dethiobiotin synthetase
MSAIFVTATGTDAGKTFVAAGLIRHFRAAGRPVSALKPVMSGFDPAAAPESDAGVLLAAMGRDATLPEIDRISPWRYAAPLSPDMAARRERRPIDVAALVEFCRRATAETRGLLLIEGIGGVMVPLDARHTVLDWIEALRIPLLLIAGTYLGALSHTLTCLDAVTRRGLGIKALVVNETPGATVTLQDTIDSLGNFAAGVPIVALRRAKSTADAERTFAQIAALL